MCLPGIARKLVNRRHNLPLFLLKSVLVKIIDCSVYYGIDSLSKLVIPSRFHIICLVVCCQ